MPSIKQIFGKLTVNRIAEASISLFLSPESENAFPEPNIFDRAGQTWTTGSSRAGSAIFRTTSQDMAKVICQNIIWNDKQLKNNTIKLSTDEYATKMSGKILSQLRD